MSFEKIKHGDLEYYSSTVLSKFDNIKHMFMTRAGGVSEGVVASMNFRHMHDCSENVIANTEIVARELGASLDDVVRTHQVHGDNVAVVGEDKGYRVIATETDALVSAVKNQVLSVFYADCQPILMIDSKSFAVGAVHSGWRGTTKNIAAKAILTMTEEYGTKPQDVHVAIGPSICTECFECDYDVIEAFCNSFGDGAMQFAQKRGDKWRFDLGGITVKSLIDIGVSKENIDLAGICTKCSGNEFWSHRALGDARGVHGAFIVQK